VPGFLSGFPVCIRRVTGTRMGLTGFGWDCSWEEIERQKTSCSWHMKNEAVVGWTPWGPWPPSQWRKVPSLTLVYAWIQTKQGSLQPNFQSFSLQPFARAFWTRKGDYCSQSAEFSHLLTAQSGLVELRQTWTEELKLNVASERINDQD